ncbi:MAG: hypothetical protein ABIO70_19010 [Pseudomonadota bacterium]
MSPSRRWWLLALVVCLALALVGTWPVWVHPGQGMLCGVAHPDCAGNQWLLVWVAERLSHLQGLLHNDRYYWPVGDAPFLAGNGGEGVLYLPFHLVFGWPLGASVFLVVLVAANGLVAAWVARGAGASWPGALLAAATLGSGPYVLRELGAGRFSQADLVWCLLFLGAWLRLPRRPRWGLAAGAFLAAAAALYWYYGFFLVIFGALLLVGVAVDRRREGAPLPWGWLAVFALVFLLLVAGPLAWYLHHWQALPGTGEDAFPHPEALRDSLDPAVPFLVRQGRFVGQALPATVVLLAGWQVVRLVRGRSDSPGLDAALLASWALFLLLAMGPKLSILGLSPFQALYGLAAPLRRFWWPSRHIIVCDMALALLAARAVPALGRAGRDALLGLGLVVSVPLLLLLQGPGVRAHSTALAWPPAFYAALAAEPGEVLLQLPISPRVAVSQAPLLLQLAHGKTLLNGHAPWVDRVRPPAWDAFVAESTFLAGLQAVEDGSLQGDLTFDGDDLRAVRGAGLALVVLDRELYPLQLGEAVARQRAVLTTLFGQPEVSGSGAWAWRLDHWTGATRVPLDPWTFPRSAAQRDGSAPIDVRTPPSAVFDPVLER